MRKIQNSIVFLLTVAGLGLWVYTGLHPHDMKPFLLEGAYYGILLLFLAWVYTVVEYLRCGEFSLAAFVRQYGGGILLCLLATVMIEVSVKPSFKTLSDETNLLVSSRAMTFERTVASEVMAVRYHGDFNPIVATNAVDKRPFLFPFLESLLHLLRGFGPSNAFLLNGFLMFVFLSGVFIGTRQFLNGPLSVSAVFLVISYPVFSICGTSGGFDLLSSVFLGLSLAALYACLRGPSSEKFALLWMTLMVLSQTRHESYVYFFIVMGLLAAMGGVTRASLKENRIVVAMTPLWFLLSVWGPLVNFMLVEDPAEKNMFSLHHFQHNSLEFLRAQLHFDFLYPYNNILNLLAVALLGSLLIGSAARKRISQAPWLVRFTLISCVCVAASIAAPFAFYGGTSLHPAGVRLFLPLSIECALVPIVWLIARPQSPGPRGSTLFLLASIGLFLLYHPIAVEGRFVNLSYPFRETSFEHGVIRQKFPDQKILVIAEIPSQFTALQYGAVDFKTANDNIPNFLAGLVRHLYHDIVVIQRVSFKTGAPAAKNELNPAYVLQPIAEYETDPDHFIRISKVRVEA